MTSSPSDVVGARVRLYRDERGWTAQDLADRCASAGAPELTAAVIANIETGRRDKSGKRRRDVTIDEVLTLAWVLGVPAVMLFLPLGTGDDIALTPTVPVHPSLAFNWVVGDNQPPTSDRYVAEHVDAKTWTRAVRPIALYQRLVEAQKSVERAESDVHWATEQGQPEQAAAASVRRDEALGGLAEVLDGMVSMGVRPPAIWHERYDRIRALGLLKNPDAIERMAE